MARKVDHIVLFSGDGDFRRLVEAVGNEGVRVSVVSTLRTSPPMVADELRRQRLAGDWGPAPEAVLGIGWRLEGARDRGVGFELRIEGTRRDIANDDRDPGHRIGLTMSARW